KSRYFSRFNAVVAALRSRCAWSTSTAGRLLNTRGSQPGATFSRNKSIGRMVQAVLASANGKSHFEVFAGQIGLGQTRSFVPSPPSSRKLAPTEYKMNEPSDAGR